MAVDRDNDLADITHCLRAETQVPGPVQGGGAMTARG